METGKSERCLKHTLQVCSHGDGRGIGSDRIGIGSVMFGIRMEVAAAVAVAMGIGGVMKVCEDVYDLCKGP